jgi:cell fate (sporulation/competence/biofilm development) regulator YlbF (YheA/YmcA/DUF963 family)
MTEIALNEFELAPPSVVRKAVRDFAAALADTPQFKAFEEAAKRLRHDEAAQHAMGAYQEKQQALQALLMLNAVGAEEQAELERLRESFLAEPSVAAYLLAESDLRTVCQAAAGILSQHIGLDLAAACSSGCCG